MNYSITFFLICIAFAVQVYFIAFFFIPFVFKKDNQEINADMQGVSVVVCAWNELENLKTLIPALLSQNHPLFDLIIVDDRSTDGSLDYLRELAKLDKRIKHLRIDETPNGMSAKKYAITLAIKASRFERIVFTDADCMPESNNWLNAMLSGYKDTNTKLVLGYSKYQKTSGFLNAFIRYETSFTALQYLSMAFKRMPYMGVGRNLSYTKTTFLENNGFQPFMSFIAGDDDLIVQKLSNSYNTEIVTSHASHTVSVPKQSWNEYFTQKIRHLNTGKHYTTRSKSILAILFLSTLIFYICFGILVCQTQTMYLALALWFVRTCLYVTIYYKLTKKLNDFQEWYFVPFLEIIYIFYYLGVGVVSLNKRKISWR